jgi:hypothetical protein
MAPDLYQAQEPMETIKFSRAITIAMAFTSVAALSIFLSTSISPVLAKNPGSLGLGHDEKEFVFSGKCDNGESYRLLSYEKVINGQTFSQYDYEGPAGKGTVKTSATPRTMSVRVCRQMAEIIDDH